MAPSLTTDAVPARYYTVAEANAALGRVTERLERVMQTRARLKTLYAGFTDAGVQPSLDLARGVDPAHPDASPDLQRAAATFHALAEVLEEDLEAIAAEGVQIKDVEIGLCDWPAIHEGREVLLCWKLGEPEVAHFHDLHAGFAGRRPVSELGEHDA